MREISDYSPDEVINHHINIPDSLIRMSYSQLYLDTRWLIKTYRILSYKRKLQLINSAFNLLRSSYHLKPHALSRVGCTDGRIPGTSLSGEPRRILLLSLDVLKYCLFQVEFDI